MRRLAVAVLGSLSLVCPDAPAEDFAPPRALGGDLQAYRAPVDPTQTGAEVPQPQGDLTLRGALAAALQGSPELASLSWEVRSREARALQARTLPNPALIIEVENFGGSGERQAFDSHETTISLAQLVELGGKRTKRTRIAELETGLASWDYEARRVAVLADTTKAFMLVLSFQERAALARELESLSLESVRSVASMVRAGAVSPIEEDRARVSLERVQLEGTRVAKELDGSRVLLSATWGASAATFSRALGDLSELPRHPDLASLLAAAQESPAIARWNTEVSEREARLALERAKRIPDITAALGARAYGDSDDVGLVALISIPLPLFDRNRGNTLDARYGLARATSERRAADVSVRSELEAAYRSLEAMSQEIQALRDRIVPRATSVFDDMRRSYATGRFRYVEVLDAQRTLFETKRELLDAATLYHVLATDIERLTGKPLHSLSAPRTP
jgi:cobalt-zinc-cadmium efflux system outer membrane protein